MNIATTEVNEICRSEESGKNPKSAARSNQPRTSEIPEPEPLGEPTNRNDGRDPPDEPLRPVSCPLPNRRPKSERKRGGRRGTGRVRVHLEVSSGDLHQSHEEQFEPGPVHSDGQQRPNHLHEHNRDAFAPAPLHPAARRQPPALRTAPGQADPSEGRQSRARRFEGRAQGEVEAAGRRSGTPTPNADGAQAGDHAEEETGVFAVSETTGPPAHPGTRTGDADEAGATETAVRHAQLRLYGLAGPRPVPA